MHLLGRSTRARSVGVAALAVPAAVTVLLLSSGAAYANVALTQVSSDPYTDAQGGRLLPDWPNDPEQA